MPARRSPIYVCAWNSSPRMWRRCCSMPICLRLQMRRPRAAFSWHGQRSKFIDASLRLLRLLKSPEDISALAPLAEREIIYRLLKSPEGWRLRQMMGTHGHARRVAKSIEWLKKHFHEPLSIESLAEAANMSTSSFHAHFKSVTSMSPLQYQKQLRLLEARRLLLSDAVDAATAGHRVGYESPSQFGREYRRLFGVSPGKDGQKLRA